MSEDFLDTLATRPLLGEEAMGTELQAAIRKHLPSPEAPPKAPHDS